MTNKNLIVLDPGVDNSKEVKNCDANTVISGEMTSGYFYCPVISKEVIIQNRVCQEEQSTHRLGPEF